MTTEEIRKKPDADIRTAVATLRGELYDVRFRREVDQVADLAVLRRTRRDIARSLTILRERALGVRPAGKVTK